MLVGGASRRMGTTKALIEVDGRPLGALVVDALVAGGASSVVLVGSDRSVVDGLWIDAIGDDRPGEGPLAGLATALRWAAAKDAEVVVVAACDQPDLTGEVVSLLVAALERAPAEVAGAAPVGSDGRRHPFPAAWRTGAGDAVERLVAGGSRRMVDALDLGVVDVPIDADLLLDLDTPAELAARRDRGRRPAP